MRICRPVWFGGLLIGLWCLFAAVATEAKEGFGLMTKKSTLLKRVTPPAVFLMGTRIAVRATSVEGDAGLSERLQSQLESELLGRDQRLSADSVEPQTLIEVKVLQNEISERWEDRQEIHSRKVGKDSKGKDIYQEFEVSVRYKVVTHGFSVSYKVTDQVKAASLDADTIQNSFEHSFREGTNAPANFTLENSAITSVVDRIARRITPTRDEIGVLLPKGRLADLAGLADAGLWNRYLESVEALAPSPKPEDEAYRKYALGTAYEALGYAADEPATTLKYLEKADSYYNDAISSKPDEKYFAKSYDSLWSGKTAMAPLERVRSALVSYRRIEDFRKDYDAMVAAVASESGAKSIDEDAGQERMNNAAVIRMVKAGLGNDIILTAVETATDASFDISPNGLIELSKAKVDAKIIARLQELAKAKKAVPAANSAKKVSNGKTSN